MTTARIPRDAFASTDTVGVQVGNHHVVVTLTDDGPFAYADRCPHRGAPMLAGGRIVSSLRADGGRLELGAPRSHVRCPWHKWDFELATGRCAVDPRLRLRTYTTWTDGDEIVVALTRAADDR